MGPRRSETEKIDDENRTVTEGLCRYRHSQTYLILWSIVGVVTAIIGGVAVLAWSAYNAANAADDRAYEVGSRVSALESQSNEFRQWIVTLFGEIRDDLREIRSAQKTYIGPRPTTPDRK